MVCWGVCCTKFQSLCIRTKYIQQEFTFNMNTNTINITMLDNRQEQVMSGRACSVTLKI